MIDHYELLYIIPGSKTEEEAKPIAEKVQALVKRLGGTITKADFWGKRKLAYEIDKQRQGFYDYVEFDAEPSALADIEKEIRLSDDVLRHQLLRRIVQSAEAKAKTEALQQRIAAKRQAQKEKQQVETIAAKQELPKEKVEATAPVAPEELEHKLEEILESDKVEL